MFKKNVLFFSDYTAKNNKKNTKNKNRKAIEQDISKLIAFREQKTNHNEYGKNYTENSYNTKQLRLFKFI